MLRATNNLPIPVSRVMWENIELFRKHFPKTPVLVVPNCIWLGIPVIISSNILQLLKRLWLHKMESGREPMSSSPFNNYSGPVIKQTQAEVKGIVKAPIAPPFPWW